MMVKTRNHKQTQELERQVVALQKEAEMVFIIINWLFVLLLLLFLLFIIVNGPEGLLLCKEAEKELLSIIYV